jgi:uncharacterized membrane protein YdjX (TVP38/TMEM64 family)
MKYVYFITYIINVLILGLIFLNFLDFDNYNFYLNSEIIKEKKLLTFSCLFIIYVILVIFNLPLTAFITAYSGALLGVYETIIYVFFASSFGCYLSLIVNRYFNKKNKFIYERLAKMKMIFKPNIFIIILLRAVPVIPFSWVIIYVSMTSFSAKKFLIAQVIGCLSTIILVANLGKAIFENNLHSLLIIAGIFIFLIILGSLLRNYLLKK